MALPELPVLGQNPWYTDRNNFDTSLRSEIDGRLSVASLNSTYSPQAEVNARAMLLRGTNSSPDRDALQAIVQSASAAGAPVDLRGTFLLTGASIAPTSAITVDATHASFTQTDNYRPCFVLPTGSFWHGGRITGKGSDWVNNSGVYAASAIAIATGATNVTVSLLTVRNMAGAGVDARVSGTGLRILNPDFEGPGAGLVPAETGQFGGGLVSNALSDFVVSGGRIAGFAQGIVTGAASNFYVGGGLSLSCVGQHGIYFTEVKGGQVQGVRIINVPLQGLKTQISSSASHDFDFSSSYIENTGSHAVLITNVQGTPTLYNSRIGIHNLEINIPGSLGDVINLQRVDGAIVSNIQSTGGAVGMRLTETSRVMAHHMSMRNLTRSGVRAFNTTDSTFDNIEVINPASANDATDRFGFYVLGANSARLRFLNNSASDTAGLMEYAYYSSTGTATTDFLNNRSTGGLYGYRGIAATSTGLWLANDMQGTTSRYFNTPPNATVASGATAAQLEAALRLILKA